MTLAEFAYTCEALLPNFLSTPSKSPITVNGCEFFFEDAESLQKIVESKIWFTYRKSFVQIGGDGPDSDTGWGCMLRCGQMVLAESLIRLKLGKKWKWDKENPDKSYLQILRLFQDKRTAPYSIHQIALMGQSASKNVGEWFGPNTVAQVLKQLCVYENQYAINIHVALDNTVTIKDIKLECAIDNKWKPLLLFIPLRLGLAEMNSIYTNPVKDAICMKQSVGIIGGKTNHALFFFGVQDNNLLYFDPHTTQEAVDLDGENPDDSSYHCSDPYWLDISCLDPSIALCFFCSTEEEFDEWCAEASKKLTSGKSCLFELCTERSAEWQAFCSDFTKAGPSIDSRSSMKDSDDEFELLC